MKTTLRLTVLAGILALLATPAFSQQQTVLNADDLREQVRRLESINVDGKSASVQAIHKGALLAAYSQLQKALLQDIEDVKKIRASLVNSPDMERQISAELEKLTQEEKQLDLRSGELSNFQRANIESVASGTKGNVSNAVPTDGPTGEVISNSVNPDRPSSADTRTTGNSGSALTGLISPSRTSSTLLTVSAPLSALAAPSAPQTASTSLNADLNNRVKEATRAKIQQRSASNQTETPSVSNNSTSLVDTSSAGDLVNLGLNLAGLTGASNDGSPKDNSVSVTTSAYALYSALKGADPLNPGFYNRNSGWRRLSFTLGYDDEKVPAATFAQSAKIFGLKYLFMDKRDPSRSRHKDDFDLVASKLEKAASAFGKLSDKVNYYFFTNKTVREKLINPQFKAYLEGRKAAAVASPDASDPNQVARIDDLLQRLANGTVFALDSKGVAPSAPFEDARAVGLTPSQGWKREESIYFTQFTNDYLSSDYRNKLKEAVGQKVLDELDAFVDKQLTDTQAYEDLSDSTREAIERIRRSPQLSFYFLTKQRPSGGDDDYTGEAILDYGVANRINLTVNGNYIYKNSKLIGGDTRSGKISGQFRFQLTPEKLTGRNPFFFFLAGDAETKSGNKSKYHLQAKVTVPILNGLDLPFSLTYGNQPELNKEKTIKGQLGFTIDMARILQALTPK